MARSSPTRLGQTEKAKVALREKTASVGDLDAFIRRSRLRAAESVDDTRRALEDVLPASASRPSLAGHRLRGASDTHASASGTGPPATPVSASKAPFDGSASSVLRARASSPKTTAPADAAGASHSPVAERPFPSPGASARSSRSSHRTPARPLPPERAPRASRSVRDPSATVVAPDAPDAPDAAPAAAAADSGRRAAPSPRAATPRADDNARVLAAMAAKTRARARSAGIGDPRSRLTVAFDSGRDAGVFGFGAFASSPGKLSVKKEKEDDDDDALVAALRGLLARLAPSAYKLHADAHAASSRSSFKLHRRNAIDELLWKVEHFASVRIQARWRGGEVRAKELPGTRRAVLLGYRATRAKRRDASFVFWRSWSVTRRRLRTRARALSLKHGTRAHYHLGRKTSDRVDDEHVAGGSCDAWTYFEDLGKNGVAVRFRRWRLAAFTFCVWRSRVAFG